MAQLLLILTVTFVFSVRGGVLGTFGRCGVPKYPGDIMELDKQFADDGSIKSSPLRHILGVEQENNRIIGGYDATDDGGGQFCWQVAIVQNGEFMCGGTILGTRVILTVAHCLFKTDGTEITETTDPNQLSIYIGGLDNRFDADNGAGLVKNCGRKLTVKKIIRHEDYDPVTLNNDVAILITGEIIYFKGTCACPVCLVPKVPTDGEICVTSGYGLESPDGKRERTEKPLRWVYLDILRQGGSRCTVSKGGENNLDNFICAGSVKGQDSCQGDSGGPLVCWNLESSAYYLAGVVSHGESPCATGTGAQYTKIEKYYDWIMERSYGNIKKIYF